MSRKCGYIHPLLHTPLWLVRLRDKFTFLLSIFKVFTGEPHIYLLVFAGWFVVVV
jgi:hypothetical protein